MRQSFPGSHLVTWRDFAIEIVEQGARRHRECLDGLREEVLRIAALSRGWDDPETLEFFHQHFKVGPLYEANALALVYREDRLIGLAGTVNDWAIPEGSIVHLCSLGLLPQVQRRGFLQGFMSLLWLATLREPKIQADLQRGRLFATAITQSPYIIGLMQRIAEIYPSPDREVPRPEEQAVARAVLARFDAEIPFDDISFVLREECLFRYRKLPASLDRRLTRFCTDRLRIEKGDVFMVVGAIQHEKLLSFIARQRSLFDVSDVLLAPVLPPPNPNVAAETHT
jgi:hypothetical protein